MGNFDRVCVSRTCCVSPALREYRVYVSSWDFWNKKPHNTGEAQCAGQHYLQYPLQTLRNTYLPE